MIINNQFVVGGDTIDILNKEFSAQDFNEMPSSEVRLSRYRMIARNYARIIIAVLSDLRSHPAVSDRVVYWREIQCLFGQCPGIRMLQTSLASSRAVTSSRGGRISDSLPVQLTMTLCLLGCCFFVVSAGAGGVPDE